MIARFRRYLPACTTLLLALAPALAQNNDHGQTITPTSSQNAQQAQQALDKQQAVYIENRGQWDQQAKFVVRSNGLDLWITDHGVVYDVNRVEQAPAVKDAATPTSAVVRHAPVFMTFTGASNNASTHGAERAPGVHNYFIGNDPAKWATNVPLYNGARIEKLYNGIDAVFYLDQGRPRYDLVLAPGADVSQVKMKFDGAEKISIDKSGSLVIRTSLGEVTQRELFAYQNHNGKQEQVRCAFKRGNDGVVRFDVGAYDRTLALVIDPVVVAYSTYFGGSTTDQGNDIAVDASGNAYVIGNTSNGGFPLLNAYQTTAANGEAVVSKMAYNGSGNVTLVYSTYIGGSGLDQGNGIAVDAAGSAYITGYTTSTDFPTLHPFQTDRTGDDAWVAKLAYNGSGNVTLVYSTYLGGNNGDRGFAIAIDGSGDAYVTGQTQSTDFPNTKAYQSSGGGAANIDAFMTRLTYNGSGNVALVYSTYLGGSNGNDVGNAIAIDGIGNVYITGTASSSNFPIANQLQTDQTGDDAFVTKLNYSGSGNLTLVYSTYLGGNGTDNGNGIALNSNGDAYVTGLTGSSAGLPLQNALQTSLLGGQDAFVAKLSYSGNVTAAYCTYLGGSGIQEGGNAIAVDASGNAFVIGTTNSTNFPTQSPTQPTSGGLQDVFVTELSHNGVGNVALVFSTYLGGNNLDQGYGIALDPGGNAYVTGVATSTNFPTVHALQTSANGFDEFVTKFTSGTDVTLPVELAGFNLSSSNTTVNIAWRTASEVNNAGFEVQRSSELDTNFAPIASYLNHPELIGLGTTSQGKNYSLTDEDLTPGVYRYRLVDVSTEGIRTAHEPKMIRVEDAGSIDANFLHLNAVTPNPVNTEMQVGYSLPEEVSVTMEVFATDGRLVATPLKSENRSSGSHSETISVSELAPGAYTLRLIAGGSSRTQQFVVVR